MQLTGVVEGITYQNEGSGYTVARISTEDWGMVTIVGTLPSHLRPGERVSLDGDWLLHPKYGRQYRVERIQVLAPATLEGIRRYLGSGLIKGIGPVAARRLVEAFGMETLEIIESSPHRLKEIPGIGEKKSQAISQALRDQKEVQSVMVFLQSHGVSPGLATRIYQVYGSRSISVVGENPYRLAREVTGVGFRTADTIAQAIGIAPDSPARLAAGLEYVLTQATEEGHCCLPQPVLYQRGEQLLGVHIEALEAPLRALLARADLVSEAIEGQTFIYLPHLAQAEAQVAAGLTKLLEPVPAPIDLAQQLKQEEDDSGLLLAPLQRQAVLEALARGVLLLTGGPGTGKTTITRLILRLIERNGGRVLLASPTGRAAKRLGEATGRPAKTIHRLLEMAYNPGEGLQFQRGVDNPLNCDVVIIDEFSMVDLPLFHQFLRAIRPGTRLILVGDQDQLPSVGPGHLLGDLLLSQIPQIRLTEIFRQAQESTIVMNAHRINQGEFPVLNSEKRDFFFLKVPDPPEIAQTIRDLLVRRLPRYLRGSRPESVQVLTPMRRGEVGVDALNPLLQEALNPARPQLAEVRIGGRILREGDRVMQIRNNYQKGVYNGEVGRIRQVDPEEREVKVVFGQLEGDRMVTYEQPELDQITLAYAISVHKSQGSEYSVVILPMTTAHYPLLQRNLLYTAVTRAKDMVILVGTAKAIHMAIQNQSTRTRYTGLTYRLSTQTSTEPVF